MKSILITGSTGMVGRSLVKNLKNKYKIFTPSSKELDLNNIEKIEKYLRKKKTYTYCSFSRLYRWNWCKHK